LLAGAFALAGVAFAQVVAFRLEKGRRDREQVRRADARLLELSSVFVNVLLEHENFLITDPARNSRDELRKLNRKLVDVTIQMEFIVPEGLAGIMRSAREAALRYYFREILSDGEHKSKHRETVDHALTMGFIRIKLSSRSSRPFRIAPIATGQLDVTGYGLTISMQAT